VVASSWATVCCASATPAAAGLEAAALAAAALVAAGADGDAVVLAGPLLLAAGAWLPPELQAVTSTAAVTAVPADSQYLGVSFIAFPSTTSLK
jgi:hypothetical protein